jgi:hypothetical protein
MSAPRSDYIERLIEQFAEALRQILALRRQEKLEEAVKTIHQTSLTLLGMEYSVLTTFDAQSVAGILGQPAKISALADLVEEEANVLAAQQDLQRSEDRLAFARALRAEAARTTKSA